MPITAEDLTEIPTDPSVEPEPEVRIVDWVAEVPKLRRSSPFDPVVEQIRATADSTRSAKLEWGRRTITANKVNQLRKRYPDVEFVQVTRSGQRETYARYRGEATE